MNAKLLFTNKLFRSFPMKNDDKLRVVETFDRAQSLREVKLVYSTLAESFGKPVKTKIKENKKKDLKVFFISVDPERDTPEVIKNYLSSFENNFIGITGEAEKIFLLSQSWGIISQKIFFENGEYNVDHSSPVILLKNGKYVAKISHRDDIKKSIKILNKYL